MVMRTDCGYTPGPVPSNPADIPRYLEEEFRKISASINNMNDGYTKVNYKAPLRPEPGMRVYADGNYFNPGSGEGWYGYTSSDIWIQLG